MVQFVLIFLVAIHCRYSWQTSTYQMHNVKQTMEFPSSSRTTEQLNNFSNEDVSTRISTTMTFDDGHNATVSAMRATTTRPNHDDSIKSIVIDSTSGSAGNIENSDGTKGINVDELNKLPTTTGTNQDMPLTFHDHLSYTIGKAINTYAQPMIAVVGVIGNTISILVMFQPNNRRTSFGVYTLCLHRRSRHV